MTGFNLKPIYVMNIKEFLILWCKRNKLWIVISKTEIVNIFYNKHKVFVCTRLNILSRNVLNLQKTKSWLKNSKTSITYSSISKALHIYKVVISVCLSVLCPIINQEHLDRFASIFDRGTRETHGNVFSLALGF